MSARPASGERVLQGIAVSAGVCRGRVLVLGRNREALPQRSISPEEVPAEIARLEAALVRTRHQLQELQRRVADSMGSSESGVFEAHLLVLEDPMMLDEVTRSISGDNVNAEAAWHAVAERYMESLGKIEDEYLRERVADMRDVTGRVLNELAGRSDTSELPRLTEPCIVVSHDLSPSTTAMLDRRLVLGFATEIGGRTSHTAIMARSLQIPAIVGLRDATQRLRSGDNVLLDGFHGLLILNPTDQTLYQYGQLEQKQADLRHKLDAVRTEPAVTLDGLRITLSANMERFGDIELVRDSGAEGVGLFRTEFLFLNRDTLPTEAEQYQTYQAVAAALKPQPIVIRTLDLGGDKFLSHLQVPQEMNPFLGWRAIRFCLQEPEIFSTQLRAVLRASTEGNVKLMYPMISGLEELEQANQLLQQAQEALRTEGIPFDPTMEVGAMIEIPSAVLIADSLAQHVKFFSIGTNDLIQYTLAVDRLNEKINHLYEPTHPAIVRLIHQTVEAAHRHGIWVGVCGEMAGDPALVPLLVGLGVDELSAAAAVIPQIKFLLRRLKTAEAKELATFALESGSGEAILKRCRDLTHAVAPGLLGDDT